MALLSTQTLTQYNDYSQLSKSILEVLRCFQVNNEIMFRRTVGKQHRKDYSPRIQQVRSTKKEKLSGSHNHGV